LEMTKCTRDGTAYKKSLCAAASAYPSLVCD
jgi:hypothetical protein